MISDKSSLGRHPLTVVVVGFILTGVVGLLVNNYIQSQRDRRQEAAATLDSTLTSLTALVSRWEDFGRDIARILELIDNRRNLPELPDSVALVTAVFAQDMDRVETEAAVHTAKVCMHLGDSIAVQYRRFVVNADDRLIETITSLELRSSMTLAGSFRVGYDSIMGSIREELSALSRSGLTIVDDIGNGHRVDCAR